MTRKGQVTVPKRVRDALGLKAGSRIAFDTAAGGEVVLRPVRRPAPSRFAKVRGTLKDAMSTDQIMALLRGD
jgi:AbrB family looped-hinge helix DNA binding protein